LTIHQSSGWPDFDVGCDPTPNDRVEVGQFQGSLHGRGLAVEARPGDPCCSGHSGEGHVIAGGIEAAQGVDGAVTGVPGALLSGGDEGGVVAGGALLHLKS